MRNMPMCPMMMQNMPMMPQMPMGQMPMMHMNQMPMMQMPMEMDMHDDDEDEKDEEYFAGMHSEACHKMMPYVNRVMDRMEQKGDMLYEDRPKREMVEGMTEEAYNDMVNDMPEMAGNMHEDRQYHGHNNFGRDLLQILLINELLRRRRRRRHGFGYPDYGYPGYGPGYGYPDYDYNDFYYNE